jgi:hypothetical protein
MEINGALSSAPLPRWVFMWAVAVALYAGCKWLTYREALARRSREAAKAGRRRTVGYLLFWPGMDAPAFLYGTDRVPVPRPTEWTAAALKTLLGVALIWVAARLAQPVSVLLAGWVGMTGLMFVLHFGTFHLLSLGWRTFGVDARPVMRNPLRSTSLAEFWGRRWNTAFHELATRFTFPRCGRWSARWAAPRCWRFWRRDWSTAGDLVRGRHGLTGYFSGAEPPWASARGSPVGLGRGWRGRLFTVAVAAGPAFWLFPPVFVRHVILPMLGAIGAL